MIIVKYLLIMHNMTSTVVLRRQHSRTVLTYPLQLMHVKSQTVDEPRQFRNGPYIIGEDVAGVANI